MVNRQEQCVSMYLGEDDKKEALWKEIQWSEVKLWNVHDFLNIGYLSHTMHNVQLMQKFSLNHLCSGPYSFYAVAFSLSSCLYLLVLPVKRKWESDSGNDSNELP